VPVVGDAREPPAQLDHGRQLATLPIDGADRSGISLGDDEHHFTGAWGGAWWAATVSSRRCRPAARPRSHGLAFKIQDFRIFDEGAMTPAGSARHVLQAGLRITMRLSQVGVFERGLSRDPC
jgi:hypothetical protein